MTYENDMKDLLATAQEANPDTFVLAIEAFFDDHDIGDFGKVAHSKSGDTVLHVLARSCGSGGAECARYLVNRFRGSHFVHLDIRNLDAKTPLHESCQHGQLQFVQFLLEKGAKVNMLKRADWSPAMLTVTHPGRLAILQLLVQYSADLNLKNKDGWSVFHLAARTGDIPVLQYLLKLDTSAWSTVSKNGRTPLHTASLSGHPEVVSLLLSVGSNHNSTDSCGSTPLMDAVRSGSIETIDILLSCESVERGIVDKVGRSPIHIAAETGSVTVLQHLCKAGFRLDALTSSGQTPIHAAAREGQSSAVNYLVQHMEGQLNARDENGRTPLFLAVSGQHTETCRTLILAGAALTTDNSGVPLLQLARKPDLKDLLNKQQ